MCSLSADGQALFVAKTSPRGLARDHLQVPEHLHVKTAVVDVEVSPPMEAQDTGCSAAHALVAGPRFEEDL